MAVVLAAAALLLVPGFVLAGSATERSEVAVSGNASAAANAKQKLRQVIKKVKQVINKIRRESRKLRRVRGGLNRVGERVAALESAAGGSKRANYAAAAFTPVEESTHNNMGESVCGMFVPTDQGAENQGDLDARLGSFLSQVTLPDASVIESLALFANDFSAEDAHLYLLRKRIEDGLSPQFDGYEVLASVSTEGAENNVMREFATTVNDGAVDHASEYYFLELVVCDAIEPFTAQVGYR